MKPLVTIPVGVLIERHKAASKWIDYTWRPLPGTQLTLDPDESELTLPVVGGRSALGF